MQSTEPIVRTSLSFFKRNKIMDTICVSRLKDNLIKHMVICRS